MDKLTYIASCSFGKDSIATILLALEHKEPLDRVVFSEVMFDNKKGISGEIPEHIEWVYNTAIPKLVAMGVKVDIVRSERDFMYFFANAVGGGKFKGLLYGFPIGKRCVINRDCKVTPIKQYIKQFGDTVQYIGIAYDEKKRLSRLKGNKISLLAKYQYTEAMAYELCKKHNLLSPIYKFSQRGGCWFCMNTRIRDFAKFKSRHPDLWDMLLQLGKTPNLCSYGFKYGMTIEQVDKKINTINRQLKLTLWEQ
ncbi:MAG: hypothetical protein J6L03_05545 [Bacteroidaceae bacterium]|nr:hypothetical protein [Bacteroidaceae bacterium]